MSRQHAEFVRQGPVLSFSDLGSRNGTHVDGRRTEHAALADGAVLRLGECVGVVSRSRTSREFVAFSELAPGLWGGAALASALETARQAAGTNVPMVVVGETGTGKERVARAIHHWSGRRGRFHALNCAALSLGLAEAELFGHQRGAFTGAERSRVGHLRAAHGGTLFLDEVTELPLPLQSKLLRAIEDREVIPLGDTMAAPADARIVVAAHEPLARYVCAGVFRKDLAARLAGFQLTLPSLRQRRSEIPGLFLHFLSAHAGCRAPEVDAKLLERVCLNPWSDNVRELELFARKLLALHGSGAPLTACCADRLLPEPGADDLAPAAPAARRFRDRREAELSRLKAALEKTSGNLTAAALSAGISRRRAYRLLDGTPDRDVPNTAADAEESA